MLYLQSLQGLWRYEGFCGGMQGLQGFAGFAGFAVICRVGRVCGVCWGMLHAWVCRVWLGLR